MKRLLELRFSVFLILALVLLSSLAGCKSDVDRYVEYMEELKTIMDNPDCDALAADLEAFEADHREDLRQVMLRIKALPEEQKEVLREEYGDRIDAVHQSIEDATLRCIESERFREAFGKFKL